MKLLIFISSLLLAQISFANCPMEFPTENICGTITWLNGPYLDEDSHMELTFWKKGQPAHILVDPSVPFNVTTFMVMGKHGHPGGIDFDLIKLEEGRYQSRNVVFYGMGTPDEHWQMHVTLSHKNNDEKGVHSVPQFINQNTEDEPAPHDPHDPHHHGHDH